MTRLLLVLLVTSNAVWFYVRASKTAPSPRRAVTAEWQEVAELEQRIEAASADLGAATEERARREVAAAELAQRQRAAADRRAAAGAKVTGWYQRLSGRDAADADAVRSEVRAGIRSDDPVMVLAAVQGVGLVARVDGSRGNQAIVGASPTAEPLRPFLLPLLDSPDEDLRDAAADALRAVGVEPEDLPRLLALEGNAWLRATLAHLLRQAAGDPVPPSVREVVLQLLDDKSPSVVDHTLAAWGTTDLGPEYIEKVIDLARRPETSRSAIMRVLARLDPKPEPVIDVLLDAALSQAEGTSEAAIEGLKHEVRDRDRIADFFLRLLQLRNDPQTQIRCLDLLERCGRRSMMPVLEAWAREVEPAPYIRREYDQTMEALDKRP